MKQIILLFTCLFALQGLVKADDDRAITVDQLPVKAQEFIKKYFPKNEISFAKMEKDFWEKEYEVVFVNGEKAEFLKDGSWKEVDCKFSTVPAGIVPPAIRDYINRHYPEAKVLKIEQDSKTYEVKLNNLLELEFNRAFQLIDIDN